MCLACKSLPTTEELDAFGAEFLAILNHGATALLISLGYRTGLFTTLKDLPPSTSHEIARAAGLQERYVREWLGGMTAAGIVEANPEGTHFQIKSAPAALLADTGNGECLAHLAQYIGLLGSVEDHVLTCFREGGGVPYSAYPRFHDVMATDSGQSVLPHLFEKILPLVPGLKERLRAGLEVLDAGCGRGLALLLLAEAFPASHFTGYDLSPEAIAEARAEAARRGIGNVRFEVRDLTTFHLDAPVQAFDFVTTFDAIHDQGRPDHLLRGLHRCLKPDGVYLAQDIAASSNIYENRSHPIGPLLYTVSCLHCMTVSLAQGGLGVGAMWGEELTREFLHNAGFRSVERHALAHDIQNYYYVVRP